MTPRIPSATYRLQFNSKFTFHDAIELVGYLDELGISDIYASPFFQAGVDSTHGYDVANHNRLNPDVGDSADLRRLVGELRGRNMGMVLDFVPNHMGVSESLNAWWMEVLEDGLASPYADYFDIDWYPGKKAMEEKLLLPILGDRYGVVLEKGEFQLICEQGGFHLQYFDTRIPINGASMVPFLQDLASQQSSNVSDAFARCLSAFQSGDKVTAKQQLAALLRDTPDLRDAVQTRLKELQGVVGQPESFDRLHELLEEQAYRLCYWRAAAEEINYRRFFDINTLAAIRVEKEEVFEEAHRMVLDWLRKGYITGLRIDHVDGLWDPRGYLEQLQQRAVPDGGMVDDNNIYLVVEKILEAADESLPETWPVHGTTGYEFANHVVHLLADAQASARLTRTYETFTGNSEKFADLVYEKKLQVMEFSFASELASLGRDLDRLSEKHRLFRDFTRNVLTKAIREVAACFPVYRTYASEKFALSEADQKAILKAVSAARRRNPSIDKPVFDFLRNLLLLKFPENLSAAETAQHLRFVMRFQQFTSPVTAKGLEDTALYLYHRLVALNEVGGNPGHIGLSAGDFHRLNKSRCMSFPHSMLATSTHDTKRSEDTRMRMLTISELAGEWHKSVHRWQRLNKQHRTLVADEFAPSANEEYLLYQTLVGTWPLHPQDPEQWKTYVERIQDYMLKALKEGKVNSSWTEPNAEWEQAVTEFVQRILDAKTGKAFRKAIGAFVEKTHWLGMWNSLSQTILKCTVPGVPDTYQGTELWDFSLVDPDNRRPVDYALRRQMLKESVSKPIAELRDDWKSGGIKLALLARLLRHRRSNSEFFAHADYEGLETFGRRADNAVAFVRSYKNEKMLVVTSRCVSNLGTGSVPANWGDTALALDPELNGTWTDLLTGSRIHADSKLLKLEEVLKELPFCVLWKSASSV